MAKPAAESKVLKGTGKPDKVVKVLCPEGQGVTYKDIVSRLDEETEIEMDLPTALELERLGFVERV